MRRKIYVSRHGLAACPSCGNHIKLAPVREETECPFCDAPILALPEGERGLVSRAARALMAGKSSVLAASLLGVASLGACSSDSNPKTVDAGSEVFTPGTNGSDFTDYGGPGLDDGTDGIDGTTGPSGTDGAEGTDATDGGDGTDSTDSTDASK